MSRNKITVERVFRAPIAEVWALWTTKEGIESWWGPDGFAVTVESIDLRPGGELRYVMRAVDADKIAFMRGAGMPVAQQLRMVYREIAHEKRLAYVHDVDFVPGVSAYEVETVVELDETKAGVRLVLHLDAMHDDTWTGRMKAGWENELGKLEKALAR